MGRGDLRYTRSTGVQRRTTRLVSTGARAFVEGDARLTELNRPVEVAVPQPQGGRR